MVKDILPYPERVMTTEAKPVPGSRGSPIVELLVGLLLVVAFFIGPLKMIGAGWQGYAMPDILAVLILLIVFFGRTASHVPLLVASPLTIPIALIGVLCLLQLANPASPFIRSVMGLRTWLLYLLFYFVGFYGLRSLRQVQHLYMLLLVLGCVTAAYGLYQWQVGPEAFANWSDQYGHYARVMWSAGVFRAFSTFTLPNTFGANMGLLMLLAFGVAVSPMFRTIWRVGAGAAFILMGAGIGASGTRAPLVMLVFAGVIGIAVLPGLRRRVRLRVIGVALSIAAAFLVLAVIGPAISPRFTSLLQPDQFFWKWFDPLKYGLEIASAHPFGMGTGYTAGVPQFITSPLIRDLPTTTIDSGYGSAAAELGFVGFALFVYLAIKVGFEGVRAWRRLQPGHLRDLMLAPALMCCVFPVLGLIGGNHAFLPESIYFWLFVGVLMKAPAIQTAQVAASVTPPLPPPMH